MNQLKHWMCLRLSCVHVKFCHSPFSSVSAFWCPEHVGIQMNDLAHGLLCLFAYLYHSSFETLVYLSVLLFCWHSSPSGANWLVTRCIVQSHLLAFGSWVNIPIVVWKLYWHCYQADDRVWYMSIGYWHLTHYYLLCGKESFVHDFHNASHTLFIIFCLFAAILICMKFYLSHCFTISWWFSQFESCFGLLCMFVVTC